MTKLDIPEYREIKLNAVDSKVILIKPCTVTLARSSWRQSNPLGSVKLAPDQHLCPSCRLPAQAWPSSKGSEEPEWTPAYQRESPGAGNIGLNWALLCVLVERVGHRCLSFSICKMGKIFHSLANLIGTGSLQYKHSLGGELVWLRALARQLLSWPAGLQALSPLPESCWDRWFQGGGGP